MWHLKNSFVSHFKVQMLHLNISFLILLLLIQLYNIITHIIYTNRIEKRKKKTELLLMINISTCPSP